MAAALRNFLYPTLTNTHAVCAIPVINLALLFLWLQSCPVRQLFPPKMARVAIHQFPLKSLSIISLIRTALLSILLCTIFISVACLPVPTIIVSFL